MSSLRESAAQLAQHLSLPLADEPDGRFSYLLVLTRERLELHSQGPFAPGPVYVDFTQGKLAYRRRLGGGRQQALARAVGLKGGYVPDVLDATAGLGGDSFVLACLGCQVRMVERSPVVGSLLLDGLERATSDQEIGGLVQTRLRLHITDSRELMRDLSDDERPEVILLDPMYPPRTKKAQVKKEMQVLQRLLGSDSETDGLLENALSCARRRIVVKRPRLANALRGPAPSAQIIGQSTRFDIYAKEQLKKG
ncbi:MAG: class I SAM-dependent methyltransferase [Gammaproteobacteria bacterium]|nr:class I SAM-dependent methyltransferase [Gammaproteobacteria bacterium]MCP5424089.1 class I SAM-dependent methyltransferase [Gammaproteobacteria bacterium]MCP5459484.1 class I SAM-dependent methyltransferase [Gammaproteobacteria bacterium]